VRLWANKPDGMENVVPGTVVRQTFLGSSRDYLVTIGNGTQLRVVASPAENIPAGAPVWLYLPPDRCRVLSA
jgi:iron(III) transport system ATP-binding protein